MKKIAVTIMVLMCSQAFGLTLMGPPMAELEQGQKGVGFNLSYSEMDLKEKALGLSATLEDVESFSYLFNLGYGVSDEWDVFARLGLTDIEYEDFDGSAEFAYGFGTRATFVQQDSMSLGGLFQILWSEADDTILGINVDVEYYEIQIAVGPTFDYDGLSIYGGPFLHFVEGEIDYAGVLTSDIEQESEFGGYVGLNAELAENTDLQIEFQITGDAYAICTGIGWRF